MNPELPDALAISVESLSKRYCLRPRQSGRRWSAWRSAGGPGAGVDVIGDEDEDDGTAGAGDDIEEELPTDVAAPREIWALRDVSFTARRGSIVGVGGPHGAGKTTLLRVLGRTTPPTSGRATVRGRVSPPVETAMRFFEPERTGRRNVLDVAEIFGVPRAVTAQQLDEVFRFADLEALRDVELVRYSPGFIRRLAFSTVINLAPDILLTDGLPGAGDPEFRDQSLERIMAHRAEGMTVIMATSDPKVLGRFCDGAIWLEEGRLVAEGSGDEVAELRARQGAVSLKRTLKRLELERESTDRADRLSEESEGDPGGKLEILEAGVYSSSGERLRRVAEQDEALVRIRLLVGQAPAELRCRVVLRRGRRRYLRIRQQSTTRLDAPGTYEAAVPLPVGSLISGSYSATVSAEIIANGEHHHVLKRQAFRLKAEGRSQAARDAPRVKPAQLPWSIQGPSAR